MLILIGFTSIGLIMEQAPGVTLDSSLPHLIPQTSFILSKYLQKLLFLSVCTPPDYCQHSLCWVLPLLLSTLQF